MATPLETLSLRLDELEKQKNQEALALIEILSNATLFGELKKSICQYAVNGQCGLFIFKDEAKNKIPIISECRIPECGEPFKHYHIELSNITCTLCEKTNMELQRSILSQEDVDNQIKQMESFEEPNGE